MGSKTVLVFGATGQDGSIATEMLLAQGHKVVGTGRGTGYGHLNFIMDHERFYYSACDLRQQVAITDLMSWVKPDWIFNFAGQTTQADSMANPEYTFDANANGVVRIIQAIKAVGLNNAKLFQASSGSMFGDAHGYCRPSTQFNPQTPYDVSKVAAHSICKIHRDAGMWISTGILFAHESPRRSACFATKKIVRALVEWKRGRYHELLELDNVTIPRDVSWAPNLIAPVLRLMELPTPATVVLGSGETSTLYTFIRAAIQSIGLPIEETLARIRYTGKPAMYKSTGVADLNRAINLGIIDRDHTPTPIGVIADRMVRAELNNQPWRSHV
jgi:GDPmannose 4,6-dehydratase